MSTAYFDVSYLFKLHWREHGSEAVLHCAASFHGLACALHGRSEFAAAAHRKLREGVAGRQDIREILTQLEQDTKAGGVRWLPIAEQTLARVEQVYRVAPPELFLRSADALHLACAAENGFKEIYSNDRQLLASAPLFGLRGVNVIPELE